MSEAWKDCVVTVVDVIGIKRMAAGQRGAASTKMRALHRLTETSMNIGTNMAAHAHAYAWNDSVLLLAYLDPKSGEAANILSEADAFKRMVDSTIGDSYAIAVRGQTFPDAFPPAPIVHVGAETHPRCTILRASSYAMANCFIIESSLKKHKATWYVDNRLRNSLTVKPFAKEKVNLLPLQKPKTILMFKGYLT